MPYIASCAWLRVANQIRRFFKRNFEFRNRVEGGMSAVYFIVEINYIPLMSRNDINNNSDKSFHCIWMKICWLILHLLRISFSIDLAIVEKREKNKFPPQKKEPSEKFGNFFRRFIQFTNRAEDVGQVLGYVIQIVEFLLITFLSLFPIPLLYKFYEVQCCTS